MTNYNEMISFLTNEYPEFNITMGTTNELRAPAIIITLDSIKTSDSDDDIHSILSATYSIVFYAESASQFNPIPAAIKFGNLSQINFDKMVDGEIFESHVTLSGTKPLWG